MANHKYAWVAVAALGLGVPAFAAPTMLMKLDVVERAETDIVSVKGGTAADNVGDVLTFTNPIYDAANVHKIGSDQGYCVRLIAAKSMECHWTTTLATGQIMVDGPVADTGDTVLAVTGGTGAYRGTRGEMLIHARDPKASAYDFHFRLQ
jgi:allene oxide cyclase